MDATIIAPVNTKASARAMNILFIDKREMLEGAV